MSDPKPKTQNPKPTREDILRVWAVALAEREGVGEEELRRLALGEAVGEWRAKAAERMEDPGEDPLRWLIQPLG